MVKINKNLMSINHTAMKRSKSSINYIVCHYVGALGDAKANTDYYKSTYVGASADFWVGFAGDVWQGNDYYNYYSWHCGGGLQGSGGAIFYKKCLNSNSIGIEMCVRKRSTRTMNATDKDWYFEDATIESTAQLVAQLMKELDIDIDHVIRHYDVNGKICPNPFVYDTGKITWAQFKQKILSYYNGTSSPTLPEATSYYRVGTSWENGKCISQLGAYSVKDNAINACPVGYKVFDDSGKIVYSPTSVGTQASEFSGLTEAQAAAKILELVRADYVKTGVLASVSAAQMILESGYVTTALSKQANNCFGMKCVLSGNTWTGSTWDGKSKVNIRTAEEYTPGKITYINADFRKYPCIEDSIADHSAYLLGAMNGSKKRYEGLQGETDYKKAITIIKNGGYATDNAYISKICSIIERFGLDKYDKIETDFEQPSTPVTPALETDNFYRVGTAWKDGKCVGQVGAYTILNNAVKEANDQRDLCKKTHYVFDGSGKIVHTAKYEASVLYTVQAGSFNVKSNADKLVKQIKAKGIDAMVVKSGNQYVVQCGVFSVKSNADRVATSLKKNGFSSIIKTSEDTSSTQAQSSPSSATGSKVVAKAKELANIMISEKWAYSNSGNKMNFDSARKASKKVSNCALFASHVLQETGHLGKNQTFYFKTDGKVVSRKGGWERLKQTCKVTMYNGVALNRIHYSMGDIVCYNGHVNIFAGYNSKGVATWIDAGRGGTKSCKAGSPFTNNMFQTSNTSSYKVYAVVSPK